jgi:hypothetical protein
MSVIEQPVGVIVRAEPEPCVECKKPIVPGQLYAVDGPRHIHCGVKRRHPRAFGMWWRA